jgi:hypothetical protein
VPRKIISIIHTPKREITLGFLSRLAVFYGSLVRFSIFALENYIQARLRKFCIHGVNYIENILLSGAKKSISTVLLLSDFANRGWRTEAQTNELAGSSADCSK